MQLKWLFGLVGLTLLIARPGLAADSIGRVISAEGVITAFDTANVSRPLALEAEVMMGDRITTGTDSSMKIMLNDESIISQGENSEIILDEYTYNPKEKKGSSVMRATKGLFRVITGKITDLNPEQFKVKSGMATIGIRGCEVGMRITSDDEDIYILELPPGKSIHIQREDGSGTGAMAGPSFINVVQQGIVVTIREGGAMTERTFNAGEVGRVFQGLDVGVGDAGDETSQGTPQRRQTQQVVDSVATAGNEAERTAGLASTAKELTDAAPSQEHGEDNRGEVPALPELLPPPTSPPDVAPPESAPPVLVGGHPEFNDWEWGIWEDGTVTYYPNRYLGAEFLSREDVSAIVGGSTLYNLNGYGQAAASIYHAEAGGSKQVNGSASLNVTVGNSASPTWGGSFDMSNMDGDRVAFTVDPGSGGIINSEGHLVLQPDGGSVSTYYLQVNGKMFDETSLTQQSMDGQLIKPTANDNSISAAAGVFHFTHGTDAKVDGAYGVDF